MAMYTPNEFQTQLFDEIFSSTKGKRKITTELMEVLGCSRASLYRKRTGTTPLTTDELIRLADHFSLSIDALRKNAEENSLVVVCT
ncbi:MAG: helix-turn-helix domain-containing protein, partial [Schleiferiaceae bacterium]|nr:helix-turn-helix domain-containing protein [Schleiferiaceae bacterium]